MTNYLPPTVTGTYNGVPLGTPNTNKFSVDAIGLANNLFKVEAGADAFGTDATAPKCNAPEDPNAELQSNPWTWNEVFFGGAASCDRGDNKRSAGGKCFSEERGEDYGWKQNLYRRKVMCPAGKKCSAKQQLRILNTNRLATLSESGGAVSVECMWQTASNLSPPNGDGTPTASEGSNVREQLANNAELFTRGNFSLGIGKCSDPYAADRLGDTNNDTNMFFSPSTADCVVAEPDVEQRRREAHGSGVDSGSGSASDAGSSTAGGPLNVNGGKFTVTFPIGSMAPHIVEYPVEVTQTIAEDATVKVFMECNVVTKPDSSDYPYLFGGSDDPEFWKVFGIQKLQYQYEYVFNKNYQSTCTE